jgi:GNAT superfamily N-acetyltransferase
MAASSFNLRRATRSDERETLAMQARAFRMLARGFYEANVIESFIRHIGTMDTSLLDEGHYFVGEADGQIVASGGWSLRKPRYESFAADGADECRAEPVVRGVFVHPDHAGCGLGRALVQEVEADLVAAGHRSVSLMATLSGIPFYSRIGYGTGEPITIDLPDGCVFRALGMRKVLARSMTRVTPLPLAGRGSPVLSLSKDGLGERQRQR